MAPIAAVGALVPEIIGGVGSTLGSMATGIGSTLGLTGGTAVGTSAIAPEVMAMIMPEAVSGLSAAATPTILPPLANAGSALVGEGLGAFAPELAGLPAMTGPTGFDMAKLAKAFTDANKVMNMVSPKDQNVIMPAPQMGQPQQQPMRQKPGEDPYLKHLLEKLQKRRGGIL